MAADLLRLNNVTLRVRDKHILENTSWTIREGQNWAIIGPNGSGKTSLARALIDEYIIVKGTTYKRRPLRAKSAIGYVSFEQQQDLHNHSEMMEHSFGFSGRPQSTVNVRHVIEAGQFKERNSRSLKETTNNLGIYHLLNRTINTLSNGEIRRVLIARALLKNPLLLVLDEPFEGLDAEGRNILEECINSVIVAGTSQVIVVTHRFEHISSGITHILCLKDCRVFAGGEKQEIVDSAAIKELYTGAELTDFSALSGLPGGSDGARKLPSPLVALKNVSVSFDGTKIIDNFSWEVNTGEHWIVSGPNGSGKSTILRLLFGDLSQVYANDVTVAGYRRGYGESLWDIRRFIGYLSPEFHMAYRKSVSLLEVVISGFYDSVGLFRAPNPEHLESGRRWLKHLGFGKRESEPLDQFSFGEQRLILLARAMVKNPGILILDEPLLGLDPSNRALLRSVIDDFGFSGHGTIIHVTHHQEEIGSCFTHIVRLGRSDGAFTADTSLLNRP